MQEVKRTEVEDSNHEVNKRLSGAIKRLVQMQEGESYRRANKKGDDVR